MTDFVHLHVHSNFSLLDGAAPAVHLCERAAQMGMGALAVTDHNSLAGAVRFFQAAQKAGVRPLVGVEFTVESVSQSPLPSLLRQGPGDSAYFPSARADTTTDYSRYAHLLLLALDNEGYSSLCRLVTCARLGRARHSGPFSAEFAHLERRNPVLSREHLEEYAGHLVCLSGCEKGEIPRLVEAGEWRQAQEVAGYYRSLFGEENFFVELHNHLLPPPRSGMRYALANFAGRLDIPVVATNNVHYVDRRMARAQDILVCMKAIQTVHEYHPDRKINAEYDLKSPEEMAYLFADLPEALENAAEIARRCSWELDLEHFHFPKFDLESLGHADGEEEDAPRAEEHEDGKPRRRGKFLPNGKGSPHWPAPKRGENSREYLRRLCYHRAGELYGQIDDRVRDRIEHELQIITDLGFCDYFLVVWDICRFARRRGIMTTGRGSAGDSIVSYLLHITAVDPLEHELLFERFLNPCRRQMPDIDVDFDSRRRDEVTAYVYRRYGRDYVAAVCTVNTFRARSAVREVGKALGMNDRELGRIAETLPHIRATEIEAAAERLPEVRDSDIDLSDKPLLLELCRQISGFPRHLSVHVGGLLIGAQPLTDMVSLAPANKGIVICEFDKDDVEALGLVKMDILGLRTHTAISDCLDLIEKRTGHRIDLDRIPLDDEATFELLRSTRTVGLFQLESPGQRNLLGRAQPREFEEVIANISLFRPGPVQSDMISPYLRRKHGLEPVKYLHPALEPIMKRTYGVLIYQEQVLEIAAAIAGFSLGEADKLRRLMTSDRSMDEMLELGESFIRSAVERGVARQVAEELFRIVSGFAAYGFCKAHAACFAKIAYQTAWLKTHYPAEFLAGILSAQPMGFYSPRTVASEATRLGCRILPPCVNHSEDVFTVEDGNIRVGLRLLRGMSAAAMRSILEARRRDGLFKSLRDFCERTRVPRPVLENLILVRAFEFTGYSEQELLWLLASLPAHIAPPKRLGKQAEAEVMDGAAMDDALQDEPEDDGVPVPLQLEFETPETILASLPELDKVSEVGRVALDLNIASVSTTCNPFSFWRERMDALGVIPSVKLYEHKHGDRVRVAGIVIARARPPTRSGKTAIFISLEDEFGLVDVAVFEDCYQRCGPALYSSPVLCVEGTLTRLGLLDISVTARNVIGLGSWRDFERPNRPRGEQFLRLENKLMERWEPSPNPRVGERRG